LFVLMIANRQSKQNQKARKNNCVEYKIPLQQFTDNRFEEEYIDHASRNKVPFGSKFGISSEDF